MLTACSYLSSILLNLTEENVIWNLRSVWVTDIFGGFLKLFKKLSIYKFLILSIFSCMCLSSIFQLLSKLMFLSVVKNVWSFMKLKWHCQINFQGSRRKQDFMKLMIFRLRACVNPYNCRYIWICFARTCFLFKRRIRVQLINWMRPIFSRA